MQQSFLFRSCTSLMLAVCVATNVLGQDAGRSGFAFLKIGVGSRAAALGGSYVAVADDPTAVYWNPAGLSSVQGTRLAFTHLNWLADIRHEFAAVTFPGFDGTLGVSFTTQTTPDIELRDKPSPEPIGTFDARDVAFGITFSKPLGSQLALGVTVKYLYEKLHINSVNGLAVDLGAVWQSPVPHLSLGASLQNMGTAGSMARERVQLPSLIRIGGAYRFESASRMPLLTLAVEQLVLWDGGGSTSAGIEYWLGEVIALRSGYTLGRESRSVAAGFGARHGRYTFDYGYAPFRNDLGQAHRFSVLVSL